MQSCCSEIAMLNLTPVTCLLWHDSVLLTPGSPKPSQQERWYQLKWPLPLGGLRVKTEVRLGIKQ